ncbi:hypothetical protein PRELSG_0909800 [Plasmodium relictum]|uniref:Uncharacterized protein n=1 Tax=Plasmodium relictum TaxID=85471 RepID=A0A1J1H514_PLARL|nr:hypothetical protein PRELSG_0909800 [Plasmodium relictum]CRG99998.1 hypothetical protein PRELSG_0909800 [Plasmodium relictum]
MYECKTKDNIGNNYVGYCCKRKLVKIKKIQKYKNNFFRKKIPSNNRNINDKTKATIFSLNFLNKINSFNEINKKKIKKKSKYFSEHNIISVKNDQNVHEENDKLKKSIKKKLHKENYINFETLKKKKDKPYYDDLKIVRTYRHKPSFLSQLSNSSNSEETKSILREVNKINELEKKKSKLKNIVKKNKSLNADKIKMGRFVEYFDMGAICETNEGNNQNEIYKENIKYINTKYNPTYLNYTEKEEKNKTKKNKKSTKFKNSLSDLDKLNKNEIQESNKKNIKKKQLLSKMDDLSNCYIINHKLTFNCVQGKLANIMKFNETNLPKRKKINFIEKNKRDSKIKSNFNRIVKFIENNDMPLNNKFNNNKDTSNQKNLNLICNKKVLTSKMNGIINNSKNHLQSFLIKLKSINSDEIDSIIKDKNYENIIKEILYHN